MRAHLPGRGLHVLGSHRSRRFVLLQITRVVWTSADLALCSAGLPAHRRVGGNGRWQGRGGKRWASWLSSAGPHRRLDAVGCSALGRHGGKSGEK